ncbi:uncharacterized protein LOC131881947 [Tigriopus californicus]|nr:uncharacterized protein LOC131881947 [Tigriopus californicus]
MSTKTMWSLALFSLFFPNVVFTAIPSLSPASISNGLGGKLGLDTDSQPIASLDTLQDAKENLVEDITSPLTNPLGALNPVGAPIIGNAGLPTLPTGPVPNRLNIFGTPTNSLGVIANSGAAIGLSALKINSILLAPLVGLGAQLSAPIIKIKSKVAAPFVFKGVLLSKPFLKTGAAIVAPTVKLAGLATDQFQEFTEPLEDGIKEALRPLTDAARPFTNAVRPISQAANLAVGNENILQDQIENVDLQTELETISQEVEVITEEVGNAFQRANVFNGQLNSQFNSHVNKELNTELNSELNVQVRSARNRRSAHYQEYPLINFDDYSNTIPEVQDFGEDNSRFGENFQGQVFHSFESTESNSHQHRTNEFVENQDTVLANSFGQDATSEVKDDEIVDATESSFHGTSSSESEVEVVESESSVMNSESEVVQTEGLETMESSLVESEGLETMESSLVESEGLETMESSLVESEGLETMESSLVESEGLETMESSLVETESSVIETSKQSESNIVTLENDETLTDMSNTQSEMKDAQEEANSKSKFLSSSIGISFSTSASSNLSSQKSVSRSSSSSSKSSQDDEGILLVSESHGLPESEVDGTAMITEEASLVVDGANNPFLCLRLKDLSNPNLFNISGQ